MKGLRTLKSFQIFKREIKYQKPIAVDVHSRPILWYRSHVDPIWPDSTSKGIILLIPDLKKYAMKKRSLCWSDKQVSWIAVPRIFSLCELVDFLTYLGANSGYDKLPMYYVHFFYLSEQIDEYFNNSHQEPFYCKFTNIAVIKKLKSQRCKGSRPNKFIKINSFINFIFFRQQSWYKFIIWHFLLNDAITFFRCSRCKIHPFVGRGEALLGCSRAHLRCGEAQLGCGEAQLGCSVAQTVCAIAKKIPGFLAQKEGD